MKSVLAAVLLLAISIASCGGSSAATCTEYAAQLDDLVAGGAGFDQVNSFLEESSETIAHLITDDPDNAQICVDAIFNAMFSAGFSEFEAELLLELSD